VPSEPLFSVIVVDPPSDAMLDLQLRCLSDQTLGRERFECIVITPPHRSGSRHPRQFDSKVTLSHVIQGGLAPGALYDRALAVSRGTNLAFLGACNLPDPDWLNSLLTTLAGSDHAPIALGTCLSVPDNCAASDWPERLARFTGREPEALFRDDAPHDFAQVAASAVAGEPPVHLHSRLDLELRELCAREPTSCFGAYGFSLSNSAVARQQVEDAGGFNTCMRTLFDRELAVRLWQGGGSFLFAPSGSRTIHLPVTGIPPRRPTHEDIEALFFRHPYSMVLLMEIWAHHVGQGIDAPTPALRSLRGIAQTIRDAALDLGKEYAAAFARTLNVAMDIEKHALIRIFTEFRGTPERSIAGYIEQALAEGLASLQRDGKTYLDFTHTHNWIDSRVPFPPGASAPFRWPLANYAHLTRHPEMDTRTAFQRSRDPRDLLRIHCKGSYQVTIASDALQGTSGTLCIPIPIEHRLQSERKLSSTYPGHLDSFIDWERGMIMNLPVESTGQPDIVIGYDFEHVLYEDAAIERDVPYQEDPAVLARCLHMDMSADTLECARRILELVTPIEERSPFEAARAIYRWLQSNILFIFPPPGFSQDNLVRSGLGDCGAQMSTFVSLCRLAGIPARGCQGEHFKRVIGPAQRVVEVEIISVGDTPLLHSWAEFYAPPYGWVSVEIQGTGKKSLSAAVIPDADMRLAAIGGIEAYEDQQFGDLMPLRICVSDEALRLPAFPRIQHLVDREVEQRLYRETRHRMRCTFSI